MSAKEFIRKFIDGISDAANIEVHTYTGKLEQAVDAETGEIQWESFKPTRGELVLVAATLVRPNLHTVNYRAEKLEQGDLAALSELHMAAVESARNGRLALVKMLSGLISAGHDI